MTPPFLKATRYDILLVIYHLKGTIIIWIYLIDILMIEGFK